MRIAVLHPAMRPDDPFAQVDSPAEVASLMPEHAFVDVLMHKATVGRQLIELMRQGVDVAVNLCDGAWDEDRPGIEVIHGLERVGLAYTGADARCYDPSRLAMKLACEAAGVGFPAFVYASGPGDAPAIAGKLRAPWIIKHPQGYGSIGMTADSRAGDVAGLTREIARITAAYGSALVEEFIEGREFVVLVAEPATPGGVPRTWPPGQVMFGPGETFRHFDSKWLDGSWMEILEDEALASRLRDAVARAFNALGGVGYARCDLRLTADGEIHVLEFNANCGLFMPEGASAADEMMEREPGGRRGFLEHILQCALRRQAGRRRSWTLDHARGRGFGLAAARDILAGEVILAGEGLPHRLVSRTDRDGQGTPLDPEAWRPVDHACDPNARVRGLDVAARRDIPAGERVSIDYATLRGVTAPGCTCGAGPCVAARPVSAAVSPPGPAGLISGRGGRARGR